MKCKAIILSLLVMISLSSCIEIANKYDKLPPGIWRGYLVLDNKTFTPAEGDEEVMLGVDELDDSKLPFNFEVQYDQAKNLQIFLINGKERIAVNKIEYGRNNSIAKDTFRMLFPEYDSYIKASYEDNGLEGDFVITSKTNYSIPFRANYGLNYRFTSLKKKPLTDISGKWECTFEEGTKDEYKAIGEFKQDGNKLTGTFRTETGDYRYLEGTIQENKAYLSVFDGTHAFLFTIKLQDENNMIGSFRSGTHYKAAWTAKRNEKFELTDPKDLTYITDEAKTFDFSFKNENGESIELSNSLYENKIKVFSIMGTWCPNCKDEMIFLKDIQEKYKNDVQVTAFAFERYREEEKALNSIKRYSETMSLNFPMLHGGLASKTIASETFPMLNKIISFPTLLILDENNEVQYIHTGFNGPATSKYKGFIEEFHNKIQELI